MKRFRNWLKGNHSYDEVDKKCSFELRHPRDEKEHLKPERRKMHELVRAGLLEELVEHLKGNKDININKRDSRGQFPLQIAVLNQDDEMVTYLLSLEGIQLGDALLQAVDIESLKITTILLDWQQSKEESDKEEPPMESSDFSSHMTPIMLACINNDYDIIRLLMDRGKSLNQHHHEIEKNIDEDIDSIVKGEDLETGRARVDILRALASSVYMCLTWEDPISVAFCLIGRVDHLAANDPIFKKDYEEISAVCRQFTVALLDECRTSWEMEVLLKKNSNAESQVPRLKQAIDMEIKEFVTHVNCQQVMKNIWTGNNPNILRKSYWSTIVYFLWQLAVLPFVYVGYFLFPRRAGSFNYYKTPMMKFFGETVSYAVFLCLIFYDTRHRHSSLRGPNLLNPVDLTIVFYLVSYVWETIQDVYSGGFKGFYRHAWQIHQAVMVACFIGSIVFSIISYILVAAKGHEYGSERRIYWPWWDPMLIAECFFSVSILLAFFKILYPFKISRIFGPVQLYMFRMLKDVVQMLLIFIVSVLSFSMALTRLYSYHHGMVRVGKKGIEEQPEAFDTFGRSAKTLFWDMFGYGDKDAANLVIHNACDAPNDTQVCFFNTTEHKITEGTGYTMYALYHLIAIIVLVNALIALMSNTLNKVQENLDQEWKFDRSTMFMKYFERKRVLPHPLYLIPCPYDVYYFLRWIVKRCRGQTDEAIWSFDGCCYIIENKLLAKQESIHAEFPKLMDRLMSRYLSKLEEQQEEQVIKLENLETTKQDLINEIVALAEGRKKSLWNRSFLQRVVQQSQVNAEKKAVERSARPESLPVVFRDTSV